MVALFVDNKIRKIAKEAEVSEATVKRALGNYFGVNKITKQRVLAVAERLGYSFKIKDKDVAIIIPSIPSYFWGRFSDFMGDNAKKEKLNFKIMRYSNINDAKDALNCINIAIKSGASVIIAALPDTELIKNKIEEISNKICVILVEEQIDIKKTCYIGEDSYKAGYELAKTYFSRYRERKSIIIFHYKSEFAGKRTEGFVDASKEMGINSIIYIDSNIEEQTGATEAVIARRFSSCEREFDCVYCPAGGVEKIRKVLKKLRLEKDIHIIGFDKKPGEKHGAEKIIVNQNLEKQSEKAVFVAKEFIQTGRYPEEKNIYVDNIMVIGE